MRQQFILFATTVLFTLNTSNIFCQNTTVVDKIIEIGTTDNRTMEHLDVLVNRIGGRLIGSDGYNSAMVWTTALFEKWGLEVEIQEVGEIPVGFNRGPWFGKMLDYDGMTLHFATPSYTAGTKGVQRGHVVFEPKTQREFDSMKGKLNGAWVLITGTNSGWAIDCSENANRRRRRMIEENERSRRFNDSVSRVNRENPNNAQIALREIRDEPALFYKEMIDAGILGIIQSSSVPIRALYSRNVWEMDFFENLPKVPDIKLSQEQYDIISKKVTERRYFLLEFDIRNHFRPGPIKHHNVFGIIRGTEFPDEYVLTGGHLDAFDVATGAVDCGTGVAPNLEAARLIMAAGGKPRRTIMFCLWSGEEFGLLGSKFWVEQNEEKWSKISNYFNRDSGPTLANAITVPPAMYEDFKIATAQLNDINLEFPFTLRQRRGEPPPRPTRPASSDHAYFMMNGIPALMFEVNDPKGYDFNYNEIWHTERDTYNMSIPEYMEHSAVVTAIVIYNLAMQDSLLSREGLWRD